MKIEQVAILGWRFFAALIIIPSSLRLIFQSIRLVYYSTKNYSDGFLLGAPLLNGSSLLGPASGIANGLLIYWKSRQLGELLCKDL